MLFQGTNSQKIENLKTYEDKVLKNEASEKDSALLKLAMIGKDKLF